MSASGAPVLRERVAVVADHTLVLPLIPESNNTPGQRNRHGIDRAKRDWKDHCVMAFHELGLPQPIPSRLFVDATFYYPFKGGLGRDLWNMNGAFAKPFWDSLTGKAGSTPGLGQKRSERDKAERAYYLSSGARIRCGWLIDDGEEYCALTTRTVRLKASAKPYTVVRLAWFDRPVPEPVAWVLLGLERGEITPEELAEYGLTTPHATHTMLA